MSAADKFMALPGFCVPNEDDDGGGIADTDGEPENSFDKNDSKGGGGGMADTDVEPGSCFNTNDDVGFGGGIAEFDGFGAPAATSSSAN